MKLMRYRSTTFQKFANSVVSRYPRGPAHTTRCPLNSGASRVTTRALTWKSGSAAKTTDSVFSTPIAAIIQASVTSLAWVCAASFGVPVVPPVWKRAARSVAEGGSPTKRSCGCSAASADRWRDPHAVDREQLRLRRARPGRAQREQRLDPGLEGEVARVVPDLGCEVWAGGHEDACARPAQQLDDVLAGQATVDRRGDSGELCRQGRGDELVTVRSQQGDAVGAAHAECVEDVGVAVHVGQQLGEGTLRRLLPPVAVRQDGQGDPVRPQAGGPDEELVRRARQATVGQRHGLDRSEVARPVVRRPEEVAHHALLTTVRCRPRSMAPSSVPMATSTTSPCLRYLGFLACRWKKSFHFSAGGRNAAMSSTGFGGALRAVPAGVPVRSRSPASRRWNRLNACSASERGVDHVAVDHRVLA